MNLIERYYERSRELRQIEDQIASYEQSRAQLAAQAERLRAQLAELDRLIADVQAAAPTTERLGEATAV